MTINNIKRVNIRYIKICICKSKNDPTIYLNHLLKLLLYCCMLKQPNVKCRKERKSVHSATERCSWFLTMACDKYLTHRSIQGRRSQTIQDCPLQRHGHRAPTNQETEHFWRILIRQSCFRVVIACLMAAGRVRRLLPLTMPAVT